jgi:N-acetylglutamate synthase-like GNAT family acetyltransferase
LSYKSRFPCVDPPQVKFANPSILCAEIDGRVAGFGSIVPKNREL